MPPKGYNQGPYDNLMEPLGGLAEAFGKLMARPHKYFISPPKVS